ncbi:MAG: TRCF domain-containing protein, partial [Bacteroidota bacterium]
NEAIDELKQEHFKDLYEEEIRKSKDFVKETTLETDFELLIPDDYVSSITERIALYKELDDISDEHTLDAFAEMLNDRFGPIPPVVQQLMDTMHLRWLARETGFEKLVLKSGKMIGYFITKQDSPFYQSEKFTRVLEFIKANPKAAKMYEKEGSLRLSFNEVNSLRTALAALQLMVDTRAAAG